MGKLPGVLEIFESELKKYEEDIEKYKGKYSFNLDDPMLKVSKNITERLFEIGQTIAAMIIDTITPKSIGGDFRNYLSNAFRLADNPFHKYMDRKKILEELKEIYFTSKPYLLDLLSTPKKPAPEIDISDNVRVESREYLMESRKCLLADANRAAVVMAAVALEDIIRKKYEKKWGSSKNKSFYEVIDELFERGALRKEEKPLLDLCRIYRNFCAHPSDIIEVSPQLAEGILKTVVALINAHYT